MSASDRQPASLYDSEFIEAVLPGSVNVNKCQHEADPPVCFCTHDWRITWGNVEKTGVG